jgi:hypothetical protein
MEELNSSASYALEQILINSDETFYRKVVAAGLRMQSGMKTIQPLVVMGGIIMEMEKRLGMGSTSDMAAENRRRTVSSLRSPGKLALFFVTRAPCSCFQHDMERLNKAAATESCSRYGCKIQVASSKASECKDCRSPYCSAKCQETDWLRHKEYCKTTTKALQTEVIQCHAIMGLTHSSRLRTKKSGIFSWISSRTMRAGKHLPCLFQVMNCRDRDFRTTRLLKSCLWRVVCTFCWICQHSWHSWTLIWPFNQIDTSCSVHFFY